MSRDYMVGYQADDEDIERLYAEWCEMQKAPLPDFTPRKWRNWILGGLAGWAILFAIAAIVVLAVRGM